MYKNLTTPINALPDLHVAGLDPCENICLRTDVLSARKQKFTKCTSQNNAHSLLLFVHAHVNVYACSSGNAKGSARGQASPSYEPKVKTISLG